MPRVTVMKGLPGSGKSTKARQLVTDTGNTVRVNRDDLRKMVYDGKWSGPREKVIVALEKAMAAQALESGQNVIIDDTNLKKFTVEMWRELAFVKGAQFNIEFMDVTLEECIKRDRERESPVGLAVIENMALRARMIKFEPLDKPLVLVDLDGTLANIEDRLCFVNGEKPKINGGKDWESFFERVYSDSVNKPVAQWVRSLYEDCIVCIVSGRPVDKCQTSTWWWLEDKDIPYHHLFMRNGGDKREDTVIKEEILSYLPKERIAFAIDDRPSVVEMWRKNGVKVYPVGGYKHYW
jgi:predicted kinase